MSGNIHTLSFIHLVALAGKTFSEQSQRKKLKIKQSTLWNAGCGASPARFHVGGEPC